jgi:Tol biopolymer transport system component
MLTHGTVNRLEQMGKRRYGVLLLMLAPCGALWTLDGQRGAAQDIEVPRTLKTDRQSRFIRLAFSPDGNTLAFAYDLEGIKLRDLVGHKDQMATNKRDKGRVRPIHGLSFGQDGKTLVACLSNGVRLLDIATGKENKGGNGFKLSEFSLVALAPDGQTLFATTSTGSVILWDLTNGKTRTKIPELESFYVKSVAFAPDGKTVATSSITFHGIRFYGVDIGKRCGSLKSNHGPYWTMAFAPDGKTLVAGSVEGWLDLWDLETGKTKDAFRDRSNGTIVGLAFSPDGKTVAAVYENGQIDLWEVGTRKRRATLRGQKANTAPIVFSPDGRTLASGRSDGFIQLWDLASVKQKVPNAEETVRLWAALEGGDAILAYRAIRTLTAFPTQTLPLLRKQLQTRLVTAEEARKLDALVADLDGDAFETREQAGKKLKRCGVAAVAALRRSLKAQPSLELRRRAEAILEHLERVQRVQLLQHLRAVEVLEHISTAEARALLEELAKGVPEARLTQEAKASLARLKKRPVLKR